MGFRDRFIHRLALGASLGVALMVSPMLAHAQPGALPSPVQFDPNDVFLKGWQAATDAERLEREGKFADAQEKLEQAAELFGTIGKFYPDWKPEVLKNRAALTTQAIGRVRPKADQEKLNQRKAVAELEGGVKRPGITIDPSRDVRPLGAPNILQADPLKTRRLEQAEAEVKRLSGELRKLETPPARDMENSRDASRLDDMRRQRDALHAELRAARADMVALRARLAAAPVQDEMRSLTQRLDTLEQERDAMSRALQQSRGAHAEAMGKLTRLEADLKELRQRKTDLERNLAEERKVANSVVDGQRQQLNAMEKQLAKKDGELAAARSTIRSLTTQLEESRAAFNQLRDERDGLLRERDQMSALLKLNEAGRIQDLIEQNMGLAKNLREANEKVEQLYRESNSDKDAYTDALRDLAIAKTQINKLRQEKLGQEKRLAEMEERLRNDEKSLATAAPQANPEEVAMLREVIQRQLRVQERRKQARDLLVQAARDLGGKDENLKKAVDLFDGEELALSPEEMKLIDGREVDGEFVSPFARDRATVNQATDDLNREVASFERAAEKSFLAGRFLPSRVLYETILEQHPGHTPALCKLGIVQMKLNDPSAASSAFRKAVELDAKNTYARRMLSFALMTMGDAAAAEKELRRTVADDPNDAKAHVLLGKIRYETGDFSEAESHFKAAISADPMLSDSYYNLAWIYSRENRMDDAREFYYKALERGAVSDPKLEDEISKS